MIPFLRPAHRICRFPGHPGPGAVRAGLCLALCLLGSAAAAGASDAGSVSGSEQRSRIVESTLKDLSAGNDAAINSGRVTIAPGTDALGAPRTELAVEPPRGPATAVDASVQSSLHKLKRETVSERTGDGRKVQVEDSLQRAGDVAPDDP